MPFSTSYQFVNLDDNPDLPIRFSLIDFGSATGGVDLVGLANGGLAGIGNASGSIAGTICNSIGKTVGGWSGTQGVNGAIDQLNNGNLVVASEQQGDIVFTVIDSATGNEVAAARSLAVSNSSDPDIAALSGGGFVIAHETLFSGDDRDIRISIRDNAGFVVNAVSLDTSLASDRGASVAQLDGGAIVVAWTRTVGSQTEIFYGMRSATGALIKDATLVDTAGSINRNVSLVALDGGGFALAYEDNQYTTGKVDLTLATFNPDGLLLQKFNVGDAQKDSHPSLTRLPNGLLAMAYSTEFTDTDSFVALLDPATGAVLATRDVITTDIGNDSENPVAAAFGAGYLLVADNDVTVGDAVGETLLVQRTSFGDTFSNNVFAGDDFIDVVFGGDFNDTLAGGAGSDSIQGGGGVDLLTGGHGSDLLEGGSGADTVQGGDGNDILFAFTADSPAGSSAADLLQGGAGNDSITGSNGFDILEGGTGNDRLDGGVADDTMKGGTGNDIYFVNSARDVTSESGGGGKDTVRSTMTRALGGGLEDLVLLGTSAINGTGNGAANRLTGNNGANILNGKDGADTLAGLGGNDTMNGGGGNDRFLFSTALDAATNVDRIQAYNVADDRIDLDGSVFVGLAEGELAAEAFGLGAAATTAAQRIIYNPQNGVLIFDSNGSAADGATKFAVLSPNLAMTSAEFFVV